MTTLAALSEDAPTRAELLTGLRAAIAALEYAAAEAPLAADEIWMHVNGVGGPDIRALVGTVASENG